MSTRAQAGFFLSVALHVVAVSVIILLGYSASRPRADMAVPVFTITGSEPSDAKPMVRSSTSSLAQQLQEEMRRAKDSAREQIRRERAAASPRAAAPVVTKPLETRPTGPEKGAPVVTRTPGPRINTADIVKSVIDGSTGTAPSALHEEGERYVARLKAQLSELVAQTLGLADGLVAEVELRLLSDGRLTAARISKSSRDEAFDHAILRAITQVRMPPRPAGIDELQLISFSTRAKEHRDR